MARLTNAQLTDLVAQLERNAQDDQRRIGVMMYEQNVAAQRIAELEAEVESLTDDLSEYVDDSDKLDEARDIIKVQAERIKLLGMKVAAQPKSTPPASPKKPAPKPLPAPASVESAPAIQITDHDKVVYAKFQALPREQKQAYYDFAHSNGFGHLGIHNVNAVRIAFLAAKAA